MKILHVIASTDPRTGGPIEVVNTLSEVWERHGHLSRVVSLDKPDADWLAPMADRVTPLGLAGRAVGRLPGRGYSFSPRLAPWLRRHARDYDAVLVHGLWNYASVGAWRGLRGSGVPYFLFVHGMLDPWFLRAYPLRARAKALFWRGLEHRVLRDAAGVLFTTEEECRLAATSFRPYRATPRVVGLGARDVRIDPDRARAAFLAALPAVRHRRFVLFLGRLHPKKGVDLLVRAFARHAAAEPDLDLVVAGPDQVGERARLASLAADLGVASRLHWPGMLTGDAKAGAFQSAAYFALPSHQENFGLAVAEALSCGTPVLITDKVNIWPEIAAGRAGVVVRDDVDGVLDGLGQFAASSAADRSAMALAARACFVRRFELDRISMGLLDVLGRPADARAA